MKYLFIILGMIFSFNTVFAVCECKFTTVTRSDFPASEYTEMQTNVDAVIRMNPQSSRNKYDCYGYSNVCMIPAGTLYYQEKTTGQQFIKACGNEVTFVREIRTSSGSLSADSGYSVGNSSSSSTPNITINNNNYNINKNVNSNEKTGSTGTPSGVSYYPATTTAVNDATAKQQLKAQRWTAAGAWLGPAVGQVVERLLFRGGGYQNYGGGTYYNPPPSTMPNANTGGGTYNPPPSTMP